MTKLIDSIDGAKLYAEAAARDGAGNSIVDTYQQKLVSEDPIVVEDSSIGLVNIKLATDDTLTAYSKDDMLVLGVDSSLVDKLDERYQGKLTAGPNITIEDNVISATGGASGDYLPLTGGTLTGKLNADGGIQVQGSGIGSVGLGGPLYSRITNVGRANLAGIMTNGSVFAGDYNNTTSQTIGVRRKVGNAALAGRFQLYSDGAVSFQQVSNNGSTDSIVCQLQYGSTTSGDNWGTMTFGDTTKHIAFAEDIPTAETVLFDDTDTYVYGRSSVTLSEPYTNFDIIRIYNSKGTVQDFWPANSQGIDWIGLMCYRVDYIWCAEWKFTAPTTFAGSTGFIWTVGTTTKSEVTPTTGSNRWIQPVKIVGIGRKA